MFVALGIQHAIRMFHIVICDLPGSTVFFHIPHKRKDFRIESSENVKCVCLFSVQLLSETFSF